MSSYAIGIDLGGTNIKAGLVNKNGKIQSRLSIKTNYNADPQIISNQIFGLIEEFINSANSTTAEVGAGLEPALSVLQGLG